MDSLVIGRFQPLHNAHLELARKAAALGLDGLLIGVGTTDEGRTPLNPFTFDEISEMWLPELDKLGIETRLYELPDINNPPKYAEHVESITGCNEKDTLIVTGNPNTSRCFTDYSRNYGIFNTGPLVRLGERHLTATLVREWMLNDGSWQDYVPESTVEVVEKLGIDHLKQILGRDYSDKIIYKGHVRLVHRNYHGKDWDVVVSKDACAIMYIDETDNVWFVRQYRVPVQREVLELPAETLDKDGKSTLDVMVEGLEEECGIRIAPSQVQHVMDVYSSEGHDTEKVALFRAYGPYVNTGQRLGEDEEIDVVRIPFAKAYDMMRAGELQGSKTSILLQHEYIRRLEEKAEVAAR